MTNPNNCQHCEKVVYKGEAKEWHHDSKYNQFEPLAQINFIRKVIIPRFKIKYPTTCAKFTSLVNELEALYNELIKPNCNKRDEILRKFFAEKGKLISNNTVFYLHEDCYSQLLNQVKPYSFDEIELTRIKNKLQPKIEKFQQIAKEEISETDSKKLEKEFGSWDSYKEKFILELIKELNDKTITERERERAKMARTPIEFHELSLVLA